MLQVSLSLSRLPPCFIQRLFPLSLLLPPLHRKLFAAAASCGHWRMIDRRLAWFCINKCAQVEGAKIVLNENSHNTHTHTTHTLPHSHPHTHLAWKWKVWRCVFHFVWSSQQKVYLKTNWKLLSLLLLLLLFDCDLPRFASADSHIPQVPRSPHLLLLLSGPLPRQVLRRVKSTKNRKCSFYFFFFNFGFLLCLFE